ncbi:DUF975 family protein [Weissella sagaensis]|jgi:uncharacterized membrane protein|uniref:DUF975 family protein n=1 Tax=Weissella sagaensis TaxID=2559928 RepID=A0ABW1RUW0_9LACO|nr:DUF975 family protein [Weissella sagaensis]MBU7567513.1 DUF975 family protein [Weissella hellenica]QDJ59540.1 DUF975 family protein [Weissella hellenica]QEA56853.1 DUF975 family protein [Weissella hellenica]UEG67666.1 DUF975 family protein [Weissella hellenica]
MFTNYDLKKQAKTYVSGENFGTALKLSIILVIWQVISSVRENLEPSGNINPEDIQSMSGVASKTFALGLQVLTTSILAEVLVGIFTLGVTFGFVEWHRRKKAPEQPVKVGLKFLKSKTIVDVVVLLGVRFIFTLLWTCLFIIPGIIKTYSYSQATLLYAEDVRAGREITSITSYLKKSEEMMRGYRMKLFWLQISFILWWILVGITYGIAGFYVVPYYQATMAEFYLAVRHNEPISRAKMHFDENDEL